MLHFVQLRAAVVGLVLCFLTSLHFAIVYCNPSSCIKPIGVLQYKIIGLLSCAVINSGPRRLNPNTISNDGDFDLINSRIFSKTISYSITNIMHSLLTRYTAIIYHQSAFKTVTVRHTNGLIQRNMDENRYLQHRIMPISQQPFNKWSSTLQSGARINTYIVFRPSTDIFWWKHWKRNMLLQL